MTLCDVAFLMCSVAHFATSLVLGMTAGEAFYAAFLAASPDLSRMARALRRRTAAVGAMWALALAASAAAAVMEPAAAPSVSAWG